MSLSGFEVGNAVPVRTAMRDGVTLVGDLYRPEGEGPWPVLFARTPYGKSALPVAVRSELDIPGLVELGYAVVVQDCRGTGLSEGEFGFYVQEAADGVDTARWIHDQPWCNGALGLFGGSYGSTTLYTMLFEAPELFSAFFASNSPSSYYNDLSGRGGIRSLATSIGWSTFIQALTGPDAPPRTGGDPMDLKLDFGLMVQLPQRLPLLDIPEIVDGPGPYPVWLEHPDYDDYWQLLDYGGRFERVSIPGLHVGGWYDVFLNGTVRNRTEIAANGAAELARTNQPLVIGPWNHSSMSRTSGERDFGDAAEGADLVPEIAQRFFDRWLKGAANDSEESLVRYFLMGANDWRTAGEWPPREAVAQVLYLDTAQRLTHASPTDPTSSSYRSDPSDPVPTLGGPTLIFTDPRVGPVDQRPVLERADVLQFLTAPLEAPLTVVGPVSVDLIVSIDTPDADLMATLIDVHPDGRAELITDGALRLRYRNGYTTPEPVEPGRVCSAHIEMLPTANEFAVGHRLAVAITSSNFPRYTRNSNTGGDIVSETMQDMHPVTVRVHHGGEAPSRLNLSVINH